MSLYLPTLQNNLGPDDLLTTTSYTTLGSPATTTSASFATLLSLTFVASLPCNLVIFAYFSTSASIALTATFEITVDGTFVNGIITDHASVITTVSSGIICYTKVLAGSHTIALQWKTSTGTLTAPVSSSFPGTEIFAFGMNPNAI